MEKPKITINQALVSAFIVVGAIAIAAVASNYSGNLQLKLGADGIQLGINGSKESPP